jgi:hypothetical protein
MKAVKISAGVLLILTVAVAANSIYINHLTNTFTKELEGINTNTNESLAENLESLSDSFKKAERFISITVSHEDLTNIEESFADIIGAAKAGSLDDVERIKSRLVDSLEHLGRLSSLNLDSII